MITWKESIGRELEINNENWDDVVECTLSKEELDISFDDGYGGTRGLPFTVWTKEYVYFPIMYDGAEWCGSVNRNPPGNPTWHLGGG